MSKALAIVKTELPAIYIEAARKFARKSKADNTSRAYRSAWAKFQRFAQARNVPSLPASPATVIAFAVALADGGAKVSTIQVKLAAIASAHRTAKAADPTIDEDVRLVLAGIRRELGTAPAKKAPITRDDLRALVEALPDTLAGKRDRALLLIGFAGAFRRSELSGLDLADVQVDVARGVTIRVKRSKTDQEGKGITKIIPSIGNAMIDPARALRDWLGAAGIKGGPVFRQIDKWGHVRDGRLTSQSVALIVKAAAERAGLEPKQFAGHSLRSGFITEAASAGIEDRDIATQTGHKSMIVLHGYIQDAGRGAMRAVKAALGEPAK